MAINKQLSFREIGRRLQIDDSLISIWCRNILLDKANKVMNTNQTKRGVIKNSELMILNNIIFNKDLIKIICGIIYGCEGAKYPASNCVAFTNSEPSLISTFVNLLRKGFKLDEKKFRAHLQIHTNQDASKLMSYWSKLLTIPLNKFYKPTITNPTDKKHRSGYLGTCTIKYYDYRIQLKLIGIYEGFMRKFAIKESIPNGSGKCLLNINV